MFTCKYCGKECKNKNSLAQHEIRCKHNPNKLDMSYIKPGHSKGHKGTNQFIKAKQLGIAEPIVTDETKYKLGNAWRGKQLPSEMKQKISNTMQIVVKTKPESYSASNVNGRVKHYSYNGFKIDGKWELLVVQYLEQNNIKWVKPNWSFEYIWKNSVHQYYPDFYLPEYNYYIEVKGYEHDRDICKYKSVKHLILIKRKEIDMIKSDTYCIFDVIK